MENPEAYIYVYPHTRQEYCKFLENEFYIKNALKLCRKFKK